MAGEGKVGRKGVIADRAAQIGGGVGALVGGLSGAYIGHRATGGAGVREHVRALRGGKAPPKGALGHSVGNAGGYLGGTLIGAGGGAFYGQTVGGGIGRAIEHWTGANKPGVVKPGKKKAKKPKQPKNQTGRTYMPREVYREVKAAPDQEEENQEEQAQEEEEDYPEGEGQEQEEGYEAGPEGEEGNLDEVEPFSAQVIRKWHEDRARLLAEGDEILQHLEHPEAQELCQGKLARLAEDMDDFEAFMKEHHPDLPELDGTLDEEEGGDYHGGDEEGEEADSGEREEPSPEEAEEGMEHAGKYYPQYGSKAGRLAGAASAVRRTAGNVAQGARETGQMVGGFAHNQAYMARQGAQAVGRGTTQQAQQFHQGLGQAAQSTGHALYRAGTSLGRGGPVRQRVGGVVRGAGHAVANHPHAAGYGALAAGTALAGLGAYGAYRGARAVYRRLRGKKEMEEEVQSHKDMSPEEQALMEQHGGLEPIMEPHQTPLEDHELEQVAQARSLLEHLENHHGPHNDELRKHAFHHSESLGAMAKGLLNVNSNMGSGSASMTSHDPTDVNVMGGEASGSKDLNVPLGGMEAQLHPERQVAVAASGFLRDVADSHDLDQSHRERAAHHGGKIDQIMSAIEGADVNMPQGQLAGPTGEDMALQQGSKAAGDNAIMDAAGELDIQSPESNSFAMPTGEQEMLNQSKAARVEGYGFGEGLRTLPGRAARGAGRATRGVGRTAGNLAQGVRETGQMAGGFAHNQAYMAGQGVQAVGREAQQFHQGLGQAAQSTGHALYRAGTNLRGGPNGSGVVGGAVRGVGQAVASHPHVAGYGAIGAGAALAGLGAYGAYRGARAVYGKLRGGKPKAVPKKGKRKKDMMEEEDTKSLLCDAFLEQDAAINDTYGAIQDLNQKVLELNSRLGS